MPPAGPPSDKLRTKMEELNRQIEEQKQQIRKMAQADSSVDEVCKEIIFIPLRVSSTSSKCGNARWPLLFIRCQL